MIRFARIALDSSHKRAINQFLLIATLLVSLHFGNFLTQPETLGRPVSYLPILIDGSLLFLALCFLIAAKLALSLTPVRDNTLVLDIPGTLIFLGLGLGAVAVPIYSAYTGDSLNLALVGYSVTHIQELFGPIVAESGYFSLAIAAVLIIGACYALFKAHLLNTKRLSYGLVLFPHALLIFAPFTASSNPPQLLTFFNPPASQYMAEFELNKNSLPPSFRSFYLTLSGWSHGAFRTLENTPPQEQYRPISYAGKAEGNKPNVLVIAMESVRADVTSPYNSRLPIRNLTPNMDQLSKSGMLVESAYTTTPHTSKALVSIFCGQFPNQEMEILEALPGGMPTLCMPAVLGDGGYTTAFFQSAIGKFENRRGLTENMGFHETYTMENLPQKDFKRLSYVAMDDYVMLDPAIQWMKQRKQKNQPFFVGMLTVVSHHPYKTPLHNAADVEKAKPYENYMDAVSYTDQYIGSLTERMEGAGLLDNTIIIITGDHGEAFGGHGPSFHNGTPHEDGMRVPLILHSPQLLPTPTRVTGLRSLMDIFPTVLDLTGVRINGSLPGKSLLEPEGHKTLSGACWYKDHCTIHYKSNGDKYIYWYGRRPNEYYQLELDPEESRNLIHSITPIQERALVRTMFSELNGFQTLYEKSQPKNNKEIN